MLCIVFVAPEALTPDLRRSLEELQAKAGLAAVVFDEAHCVSLWFDRRCHPQSPVTFRVHLPGVAPFALRIWLQVCSNRVVSSPLFRAW